MKDLEKGDLVRVIGDIVFWSSRDETTETYTQGVNLVARERRILARKRQDEDEIGASPDDDRGES